MEETDYTPIVDIIDNLDILAKSIPVNSGEVYENFRKSFMTEYTSLVSQLLTDYSNFEKIDTMSETLESFYRSSKMNLDRMLSFQKVVDKIKGGESLKYEGSYGEWN